MKFIKLRFKGISILILAVLLFGIWTYKVNAQQRIDDKCYKVNKQYMSWDPKGLVVDSQGNIYIGFTGGINVYNSSGVYIYTIKVKTEGTYEIKIDDNDMLNVALCREGTIEVYNKEGYITQEKDDKNNEAYYEYKKDNRVKKDSQGNEYKLTNVLGYTKVVKTTPDGLKNTIYKIPSLEWTFKLLLPVFMIISFLIVLLVFLTVKKGSKRG